MVPFTDLSAQYNIIKKDIDRALLTILEAGHFVHGHATNQFEQSFASYVGSHSCIGLNSGTDALYLGLKALQYSPGDEVIVPANTFMSNVSVIIDNNLTPVFVDIDEDDFSMDVEDLARKISPHTRAVVVVHLFGQPDKLNEIQDVLNDADHHIDLIEDACQAHGAVYKGKKVGTFGIFAAFSFYPHKNLGAYGDGGALVTNNTKVANMVRLLHDHGQDAKYRHVIIGANSRLDEIQAAILQVKLKYLPQWNSARIALAATYFERITERIPFVKTPHMHADRESVFNQYVVRVPHRDRLHAYLKRHNIHTKIPYAVPLHLQRATMHLGYNVGDLPATERCAQDMLSLPIYPELSVRACEEVIDAIESFYSSAQ